MAQTEVRDVLHTAQAALERGQPQETITACNHVRQQYPDAITALRLQGEAYLEVGRVNEARQSFERVLELDPYNVLAHIGLAVIAEDRGEIDRAIAEFRHAWELDPALPQLRNELTRLQRKRHGAGGPVRLTRAALANLHTRNEALLRAIREYRALLEEQPARADLSLGLVEAHWRRGDDAEAAALCRQVLAAQPQTARALLILAEIVGRRGHADEAEQLLESARAVDPDAELARALAALHPEATELALFAEEPVKIPEVEATAAAAEATGAATGAEGALSWEAISSGWGQELSDGGRETTDPFAMPAGEGGRLFAELDHELTGTSRSPSEPGTQDVAPFDLTEYDIFGPEPGPARSAQGAQASGTAQPPPDDLDQLVPTTGELSAVERLMANWDNIDSELEAARPRDDAAGGEIPMLGAVGDEDIVPFDFAAAAQPAEPAATGFDPSNFPLPPLDDEDDEPVTGPLPQAAPSLADTGWAPSGVDTVLGSELAAPAPQVDAGPQSDELSAVERLTANWDNIDSELEAARPRDDVVLGETAMLKAVGDEEIAPFDFEAASGDEAPAAPFDPSAFPLPPLDDEEEQPAYEAPRAQPAQAVPQAAQSQPDDLDDLDDLGDLPSLADLGVDVSPFSFEDQRADRPDQSFADLIELDERTGSETPAVRTGLTTPIDLDAGMAEMESVFATRGLDAVRDRLEAEELEAREAAEAATAGEDAPTPEANAADLASMDDLFGRLRQSKEERLQTGDLAPSWRSPAEQGLDDQGGDVPDWATDSHDGPPGTAVLPSGTALLPAEPAEAADPGDDWWAMSRRPTTAPLGAEPPGARPSDEAPAPLAPDVWDVGVGGTSWDTGTSVLNEADQDPQPAPAWDPAPAAQPAMAAPRPGTDQLATLEQQVAANPANAMARLMLAAAYTGHDPDRALVEYRRLVREADALVPEVVERLQEMVEDGIGGARVHRVLGDAYMKLGQFERAAEEFQRALSPGER